MDLGLANRVVLVTGSSRGMGRATAMLFGNEGARVAISYHEQRDAAHAVADEIRETGAAALVTALDLKSQASIDAAIDQIGEKWGGIDILVNNAVAVARGGGQASSSEWVELVRTNIEGTHHTTQSVLPFMRKRRWGRIVNVSSVLAVDGMPGFGWYTTAKSALHGMTRTLAKELGPFGVLVNAVLPGLTRAEKPLAYVSAQRQEEIAAALPIRRLPTANEVAHTIVFLASARNTTVTGEIIRTSGG